MPASFDPQELLEQANLARTRAYAPYSRFRVGAAVLTQSGEVFLGCNVENVSYGLTVCAERVAVHSAVAAGHQRLLAVAVSTGGPEPASPCGPCRQVLHEFGLELQVVLAGVGGAPPQVFPLSDLLPRAFGPEDLALGKDPLTRRLKKGLGD